MSLLAVMALTLAVACGDDDDDDDDATPEETSTAEQTEEATEEATGEATGEETGTSEATSEATEAPESGFQNILTEPPADAAPPEDQHLRVNLQGEPASIDPQKSNFADNITVERLIFSGLLTFDDDVNVVPLIATEVPSVENGGISEDGLTYTFHLREDATWTDGQPVTAHDFEFAIKRLFDPTVGVYYAGFYTEIAGAAETYAATDATAEEIAALTEAIGVTAVDDYTLEIQLAQPVATFLQRMALHAVLPVREDIVTSNPEDWTEPANIISNGPYRLTAWTHESELTVEANPDYFLGEPVLKKITMIMQPDTNVSLASFDSDELDTTPVPPANVQQARTERGDELQEGTELTTFALEFNNEEPPFDDPAVRRAFAAAMDRDAYVVGVRQGVGVPAITWVPPGIPGHDPEVGIPFDPEQAMAFLAESEQYPNGEGLPPIKVTVSDSTTAQLSAEYVVAQASDNLGLEIEAEILDSAAYEEAYNNSRFQMVFGGWGADYPDPDNWLQAQFLTGSSLNQYKYSNPEVDELLNQAAVELDNDARIALYEEAQRIILVDDAGIAPVFHRGIFHLVKPHVKGWQIHPLDAGIVGDYSFPRTYIAAE
jgi:oligopeptide transport system substrate-binding protein